MKQGSFRGVNLFVPWTLVALLLALLVAIGLFYRPAATPLHNLVRMNELASTMRIQLLEAIEDEKSAVLALTDEASKSFADQARQASAALEKSRREMDAIVHQEDASGPAKSMNEFNACWLQYQKLDQTILALATQNTNLKAERLSTTACAQEMKRFEESLNAFIAKRVRDGQCDEAVRLSYEALTASLKIFALHKPHIEAASDTEMDTIEQEIHADDASARKALAALHSTPDLSASEDLKMADMAYGKFMSLTTEVLRLSRLNTNVKSTELSLGKQQLISAQCQETLASLQQSVQSLQFKATR
jgi:hypothetical protein